MVGHFLRREIHHRREGPLGGERFEGPPAHAGGVEDRDLETARLQLGLQRDHVAQHGLAEGGHADQRPVARRHLHRPCGAQHRPRRLAERRPADRVQPVEPAGPEDHLDVRGDALGRQQRREGDGRDHVFRNPQRQRGAKIEGQVGAHRAAQNDRPVHPPGAVELPRLRGGAPGHDLHRGVLVGARDRLLDRAARRLGHFVLGDMHRRGRIAEDADIHAQHVAALGADHLRQIGQLVLLGVPGAGDEDGFRLAHAVLPAQSWIQAVFKSTYLSSACSDLSCPLPD